MKKIKLIFFIALILMLNNIQAQAISGNNNVIRFNNQIGSKAFLEVEKEVKGARLLYKNWQKGQILLADGNITDRVPVNIDLYKQNIIMEGENDKKIILNDPKIKGVYINESINRTLYAKINGSQFETNEGYKLAKTFGENNFIIEVVKKFIYDYGASNGMTKSGRYFKENKEYFVLNKDNKYVKVKNFNKKNIIKLYPSKKEIITTYYKENKVKNDLKKLDSLFEKIRTL